MSEPCKILVVDDTPLNVKILADLLTYNGYAVVTASSGAEGLEKIESEKPDLVLLDVSMPGMNGYEVCQKIRADATTSMLPVVMVTALDPTTERTKGLEVGGELTDELAQTGRAYLGTNSPADGLPLGLSAEAFTVATLRETDRQASTRFDREHVTTWMRRQYSSKPFRPKGVRQDFSHLRCTIDCIDDYVRVAGAFSSVHDPVAAPWCEAVGGLRL